jgi:hypothetical protein
MTHTDAGVDCETLVGALVTYCECNKLILYPD